MAANESQFGSYFAEKQRQWAQRVPEPSWTAPGRAIHYIRKVGKTNLAAELRNDGQFFGNEICAFVQNNTDTTVARVLTDVFADLTDNPYLPTAVTVLLDAIKLVCDRGTPRWLIALGVLGVGAAIGGSYLLSRESKRKKKKK